MLKQEDKRDPHKRSQKNINTRYMNTIDEKAYTLDNVELKQTRIVEKMEIMEDYSSFALKFQEIYLFDTQRPMRW